MIVHALSIEKLLYNAGRKQVVLLLFLTKLHWLEIDLSIASLTSANFLMVSSFALTERQSGPFRTVPNDMQSCASQFVVSFLQTLSLFYALSFFLFILFTSYFKFCCGKHRRHQSWRADLLGCVV